METPICAAEAMGHLELQFEAKPLIDKAATIMEGSIKVSSALEAKRGRERARSWILRAAARRFHKAAERAVSKATSLKVEVDSLEDMNKRSSFFKEFTMFFGNVFTGGAVNYLRDDIRSIRHDVQSTVTMALNTRQGFRALSNATEEIVHQMEYNYKDETRLQRLQNFEADTHTLIDLIDDMTDGIDHLSSGRLSPSLIAPRELKRGLDRVAEDARAINLSVAAKTVTEAYHLPVSVLRTRPDESFKVFIHIPLIRNEHWDTYEYLPAPVWPLGEPVTLTSEDAFLGVKNGQSVTVTKDEWQECIPLHGCRYCKQADVVRKTKSSCLGAIYLERWEDALELCHASRPNKQVNAVRTTGNRFWVTSPTWTRITVTCAAPAADEANEVGEAGEAASRDIPSDPQVAHYDIRGGMMVQVDPGCEGIGGGLILRAPRDISPEVKTLSMPDFMVKELKWPKDGIYDGLRAKVQEAREVVDNEPEVILAEVDEDAWSIQDIIFAVVLGFLSLAVTALVGLVGYVMIMANRGNKRAVQRPDEAASGQEMQTFSTRSVGAGGSAV